VRTKRKINKLEDLAKMNLIETGRNSMHFNNLAQDRDKWRALMNMAIKL
jgi:hypothetical protein